METIKRQWENERKGIDDVRVLREQIETTRSDMERAERAYDLNLVAELKHGKLPTLEAELAKILIDLIPCAEMVRFGKNGSDATSASIRLARAVTKKNHIIAIGYHGWQDWYLSANFKKGRPY